ncbi:MAG: hypothetical protein WAK60_08410 [Sedimentisphaerales bacterium]
MERICGNCRYFVRGNWNLGGHCWGDCREPAMKERSIDKKDVLKWANDTCPDFKPIQEGENAGRSDDQSC